MEECEVVARIVEAAAWWVTGERVEVSLPDRSALEVSG